MKPIEYYDFITGMDPDGDHPNGDLDRIVLDRKIMTVRDGDTECLDKDGNPIPKKKILRGEDFVYIMQNVVARKRMLDYYRLTEMFGRSLGSNHGIFYDLQNLCEREVWIDEASVELPEIYVYEDEDFGDIDEFLKDNGYVPRSLEFEPPDFIKNETGSKIEEAIKTFKKMMVTVGIGGINMLLDFPEAYNPSLNFYSVNKDYDKKVETIIDKTIYVYNEGAITLAFDGSEQTSYIRPLYFSVEGFKSIFHSRDLTLYFDRKWVDIENSYIVFEMRYYYLRMEGLDKEGVHGILFMSYRLSDVIGLSVYGFYGKVKNWVESTFDMSKPSVLESNDGKVYAGVQLLSCHHVIRFNEDLTI